MIHGGAWISGDKWNVIDHAIQMAQSGFVVMAINYRLAPAFPWPAQLVDCQAALGWIEKHAEEWQADIERLGVWGYSAGGHLALMMALEQKAELPRIRACVAGGPPCNLDYIPLKSQMLAAFLGGSRERFPDRYRDASPIYLLSPDDPPLFVFHGDQDSIVPIENSRQMLNKIVELGITHEYRAVPNLGHLMTFLDRKSRLDAIEFLKKHLVPTSP
jgi:triacylglycerol lipase